MVEAPHRHGHAAKQWSDGPLGNPATLSAIVRVFPSMRQVILLGSASLLLAGCSGASDLLTRDAEWFSRPGRMFIRNISIDAPPLTPDKPVTPDDLISAEGQCPGMGGADASAMSDPGSPGQPTAPARVGAVALGHTECDVARGLGAPDNVAFSSNERGDRVAVLTYTRGQRPGIYTFTAGRLTVVEKAPTPEPARPSWPKAKKKAG